MSNKHKHADLIHAWADGAKIQYFSKKRDKWVTVTNPSWDDDKDYRKALEDWQQELVDAVKGGKTIEFQLGGTWFEAALNDIVAEGRLAEYNWSTEKRYRVKPAVEPTIKVYSITLHGLSVDENGDTEPYIYTDDNQQFTCKVGDKVTVSLSVEA